MTLLLSLILHNYIGNNFRQFYFFHLIFSLYPTFQCLSLGTHCFGDFCKRCFLVSVLGICSSVGNFDIIPSAYRIKPQFLMTRRAPQQPFLGMTLISCNIIHAVFRLNSFLFSTLMLSFHKSLSYHLYSFFTLLSFIQWIFLDWKSVIPLKKDPNSRVSSPAISAIWLSTVILCSIVFLLPTCVSPSPLGRSSD